MAIRRTPTLALTCHQKTIFFGKNRAPYNRITTVTRVSKRIKELKAKIMSLSTILDVKKKQKRDYTCLLYDSRNIKQGHGKTNPSQTQNKKRKECRMQLMLSLKRDLDKKTKGIPKSFERSLDENTAILETTNLRSTGN